MFELPSCVALSVSPRESTNTHGWEMRALLYSRDDSERLSNDKTVPRRCDGTHLPSVLRADGADERDERDPHEGTLPVCEYRAAIAEGLQAGLCGDCVRHEQADVSRQIIRGLQGTAATDAG